NLTLQGGTVTMGTSVLPQTSFNQTLITVVGNGHLSGTGTVLFEATNPSGALPAIAPLSNGSLSIDAGITIRTDTVGAFLGGQVQIAPVVNQGTISSQTSGKTLSVIGTSVTNQGTMSAIGGGTMVVSSLTNNGQLNLATAVLSGASIFNSG